MPWSVSDGSGFLRWTLSNQFKNPMAINIKFYLKADSSLTRNWAKNWGSYQNNSPETLSRLSTKSKRNHRRDDRRGRYNQASAQDRSGYRRSNGENSRLDRWRNGRERTPRRFRYKRCKIHSQLPWSVRRRLKLGWRNDKPRLDNWNFSWSGFAQ